VLAVAPSASTSITSQVSPLVVTAGETVRITAVRRDAFGNIVPGSAGVPVEVKGPGGWLVGFGFWFFGFFVRLELFFVLTLTCLL
jgi:hypothetical protein